MIEKAILTKITKLLIYGLGLSIITVFEEPRISMLLELVFPGEFSRSFSFILPFLVVSITVLTSGSNIRNWKGNFVVFSFAAILILSYANTVLVGIKESEDSLKTEKKELQDLIDSKQAALENIKSPRTCYAPRKDSENYDDLIQGYHICQSIANTERLSSEKSSNSISSEITILLKKQERLENSNPDYFKPISQGLTGLFLSIILSIGTSVFCFALSKEIQSFVMEIDMPEDTRLAILIAEKKSIREIANIFDWSKSTADRKIREFRVGQRWDSAGTLVGQNGTAVGQGF